MPEKFLLTNWSNRQCVPPPIVPCTINAFNSDELKREISNPYPTIEYLNEIINCYSWVLVCSFTLPMTQGLTAADAVEEEARILRKLTIDDIHGVSGENSSRWLFGGGMNILGIFKS